jgi:trehalose 6-phosphate phosphatase
VAVVSGRPVAYLAGQLPEELTLVGLYGLEQRRDGVRVEHAGAAGWRAIMAEVVADARRSLPSQVEVEDKGLSLTLHFRRHPDQVADAAAWAERAATAAGLHVRPAKMSLELHPPVSVDKGTVVDDLTAGLDLGCYIGDDAGDLPAFDALDRLAGRGGTALRVAVETAESSAPMLARADLVVPGPEGVLSLLTALLTEDPPG